MNTHADRHFIIASYYFPPLGLAGTARPLALANFFAGLGYPVSVLTVKPISYPVYDRTQLDQLSSAVKVYRAGSTDPARLARRVPFLKPLLKLGRKFKSTASDALFPDSKVGFVRPASVELSKILRPDVRNILITTSPPVSLHQLGLNFGGHKNPAWIADFRDIWGSLPLAEQSDSYRSKAASYLKDITDVADLITATSPLTIEYLRTEINAAVDYHFLPNGYDESDFADRVVERNSSFGIYGTLNELVGIEKLFDWIGQARSASGTPISLRHIGYLDFPNFDALLARYQLAERFQCLGYLPHRQSIQAVRSHAANIIMLSDSLDTSYIIPSKLFELLRAEPPLIAILPPRNAARLLLEEYNFPGVLIVDTAAQFVDAMKQVATRESTSSRYIRTGVDHFERQSELAGLLAKIEELF